MERRAAIFSRVIFCPQGGGEWTRIETGPMVGLPLNIDAKSLVFLLWLTRSQQEKKNTVYSLFSWQNWSHTFLFPLLLRLDGLFQNQELSFQSRDTNPCREAKQKQNFNYLKTLWNLGSGCSCRGVSTIRQCSLDENILPPPASAGWQEVMVSQEFVNKGGVLHLHPIIVLLVPGPFLVDNEPTTS